MNNFTVAAINQELLPAKLTVEVKEGWTASGPSQVLAIHPVDEADMELMPVIHTEDLPDGLTPKDIAGRVESIYRQQLDAGINFDPDYATSKEYVLKHLQPRLVNADQTEYAKKHDIIIVPLDGTDLYIYFAVVLKNDIENGEMMSFSLDYTNMESVGATVNDLINAAKNNLRERISITSIEDVLQLSNGDDPLSTFYVATNRERHFGASVMMLDDILREQETKLGSYHIIPSSIHEVLLVPDSLHITSDDLRDMLIDVNDSSAVKDSEILSNRIYSYSDGKLAIAD